MARYGGLDSDGGTSLARVLSSGRFLVPLAGLEIERPDDLDRRVHETSVELSAALADVSAGADDHLVLIDPYFEVMPDPPGVRHLSLGGPDLCTLYDLGPRTALTAAEIDDGFATCRSFNAACVVCGAGWIAQTRPTLASVIGGSRRLLVQAFDMMEFLHWHPR